MTEFNTTWPLGNMNVYEQLSHRIDQLEEKLRDHGNNIIVLKHKVAELEKFVKGPTLGELE